MKISIKDPQFRALALLISLLIIGIFFIKPLFLDSKNQPAEPVLNMDGLSTIRGNTLISYSNPANPPEKVTRKINIVATAYSSTVWQTDDTPFITAAGTHVRDGIVANNLLPFGTKIKIPEIYGDKIFVVEDRLHPKQGKYQIDVWFASYNDAVNFGVKRTYIEVLEG